MTSKTANGVYALELLNLYDLIKNHINENFEISINEY